MGTSTSSFASTVAETLFLHLKAFQTAHLRQVCLFSVYSKMSTVVGDTAAITLQILSGVIGNSFCCYLNANIRSFL